MMAHPYMQTLATNLAHLHALIPPQPKRNLASNSASMPMTEEDSYLAPQIRWRSIPEGRPGTHRTMQTMADIARQATHDADFVKFAWQFSSLGELDTWMRQHFVYRDEHD